MNPDQLVHQFQIKGEITSIQAFGSGHINDTFRAINEDPDQPDYLLQKINQKINQNLVTAIWVT